MTDDLMNFIAPVVEHSIIKVIGVGGGGGNAVNHMFKQGIKDVDFIILNTDSQALEKSEVPVKIQLGKSLTEGLGAGNKPERGREAAIESIDEIKEVLAQGTKMAFITVGMGGGTGTGAAPIVAEAAKELGILTVGIVTIPFKFEGKRRIYQAIEGINNLKKQVDSLLVINNEKLRNIYGNLELSNAFAHADDILTVAAKGIAEIITIHGHMNVDFADVNTVMSNSGVALMGKGKSEGDNRAIEAIKTALESPLLSNNNIRGAKNILLNVTSNKEEITMDEIGTISDYIQEVSGNNADVILGTGTDENLENEIAVTIIATGFSENSIPELVAHKGENGEEESNTQETQNTIKLDLDEETNKAKKEENPTDSIIENIYDRAEDMDISLKSEKDLEIDNVNIPSDIQDLTGKEHGKTIDDLHDIPAYLRKKDEE